jgi:hypothetical protein
MIYHIPGTCAFDLPGNVVCTNLESDERISKIEPLPYVVDKIEMLKEERQAVNERMKDAYLTHQDLGSDGPERWNSGT